MKISLNLKVTLKTKGKDFYILRFYHYRLMVHILISGGWGYNEFGVRNPFLVYTFISICFHFSLKVK